MDHITLPYRFDTRSVWRGILKGALALNALLLVGILFTVLVGREWTTTLGLVLVELLVVGFTLVFIKAQEGSAGTLSSDRIVIEPNILLGIALPGPKGAYMLDRFSAVRVEFRSAVGGRTFRIVVRTSSYGSLANRARPTSSWRGPTTEPD